MRKVNGDRAAFELLLMFLGLLALMGFGLAVWSMGWVGALATSAAVVGLAALGWFGTAAWYKWRTGE